MTELLTKNKKIKKSNTDKYVIYNFGISANKDVCRKCKLGDGCYAKNGAYIWDKVKAAYAYRLQQTKEPNFINSMLSTISTKLKTANRQQKHLVIRIHDSGDFYSKEYATKWLNIANTLKSVKFYAYTKEISLFKQLQAQQLIPENMTIIFSYGGTEDSLIDPNVDRHSRIFSSLTELLDNGYRNAMMNDLNAIGPNPKIGLIYHGPKKYSKSISK